MQIIKKGKAVNVNYGGGSLQDKMEANGWQMKLQDNPRESAQELYNRLEALGIYKDIKVYWTSTQIRGLHKYFAFVKR